MLSGISKTVIAKTTFTASVNGITSVEYHAGDIITGPIEVINDLIANGWAKCQKEEKATASPENKMTGSSESKTGTGKAKAKEEK